MSDYPEHDKLTEVQPLSQAIGEFLDWAASEGLHLMQQARDECQRCEGDKVGWADGPDGMCKRCEGRGWVEYETLHMLSVRGTEQLLADHFGIDRDEIEREKRAMLDSIRAS